MKIIDNSLRSNAVAELSKLEGNFLRSISLEVTPGLFHAFSQMVCLHTENANLSFWLEAADPSHDELPDLTSIAIQEDKEKSFDSVFKSLSDFPIGMTIRKIELVTEQVTICNPKSLPFQLIHAKGIVFYLDDSILILEKTCHWSECWETTLLSNHSTPYTFGNEWLQHSEDNPSSYQSTLSRQFL